MNILIELDYRPALSPVRDQGARPTCLSFATTTAHEFVRSSTVALSPEYLHHFAFNRSSANGVRFPDVTQVLERIGQPTEVDCPYYQGGLPPGWVPPTGISLYRRKSKSLALEVHRIPAMLIARQIPVIGITVPHSFYAPAPPWVIPPDGPIRGLHAVVVVATAVANSTRLFMIRNSWGTAWGDGGYAWVQDAFLNIHLNHILVLTGEAN